MSARKWTAAYILSWIPNPVIIIIMRFIGNNSDCDYFSPTFDTLLTLSTVCKSWYDSF